MVVMVDCEVTLSSGASQPGVTPHPENGRVTVGARLPTVPSIRATVSHGLPTHWP